MHVSQFPRGCQQFRDHTLKNHSLWSRAVLLSLAAITWGTFKTTAAWVPSPEAQVNWAGAPPGNVDVKKLPRWLLYTADKVENQCSRVRWPGCKFQPHHSPAGDPEELIQPLLLPTAPTPPHSLVCLERSSHICSNGYQTRYQPVRLSPCPCFTSICYFPHHI